MAAVEPVLQIDSSLSNNIIRSNQIMIHDCYDQLSLQGEGHSELKHPEIQRWFFRQALRDER